MRCRAQRLGPRVALGRPLHHTNAGFVLVDFGAAPGQAKDRGEPAAPSVVCSDGECQAAHQVMHDPELHAAAAGAQRLVPRVMAGGNGEQVEDPADFHEVRKQ
jgi:hypothetical protein